MSLTNVSSLIYIILLTSQKLDKFFIFREMQYFLIICKKLLFWSRIITPLIMIFEHEFEYPSFAVYGLFIKVALLE